LRSQHSVEGKAKWAPKEAAKLDWDYGHPYYEFSKHVHSATDALSAAELGMGREWQRVKDRLSH
jgi:hypothetical protein